MSYAFKKKNSNLNMSMKSIIIYFREEYVIIHLTVIVSTSCGTAV